MKLPKFSKVAVLGTGTMGAQIAALMVNYGLNCLLFGLTEEEDRNATAESAIKNLTKINPPPLALKEFTQYIKPADYKNSLECLQECSLVIEAVSENIDIKHRLYKKIIPYLGQNTIFASNTSGLSIKELAKVLPTEIQDRFCGIHFFNPPRYMPLVEIIPHTDTEPEHLFNLEGFLTSVLGKQVVFAKDSPGFIANRFGIFAMASAFYWMEKYDIPPDTVDELCGSLIGRPKSACFRTADLVGLDVLASVMDNLNHNLPHDPWCEFFKLPAWLKEIIADNNLGQKTKKGVYEKTAHGILVFDPETKDYRPIVKNKSKTVQAIFARHGNLATALPKLQESNDNQANFLWALHRDLFHYASTNLADVADNVRDADQAMKSGFGWEQGIFQLWQQAGQKNITSLIQNDINKGNSLANIELPPWIVQEMYTDSGAWSPRRKARVTASSHPVYKRQLIASSTNLWPKQKVILPSVIMEDDSIRMIDLKDGIAAINFKTKMNTISFELLQSCSKAVDIVEKDYSGLIFWQPQGPFCAGANIYQILAGARLGKLEKSGVISSIKQKAFESLNPKLPKLGNLPAVKDVIEDLQKLLMRLKHSHFPVVCAVQGLALGGGCELILHSDRVVAVNDSFIGLVEIGIGVLPAGGGSKEMARRAEEMSKPDLPLFFHLKKVYQNIALAKISKSAHEALQMGYLRPADKIIANPQELLYVARKEILGLIDESYRPPRLRNDIELAGRPVIANFLAQLINMKEGQFISEHDYLCAAEVAKVLCGGDIDAGQKATDEWFLQLERESFIKLLKTTKTQERIEYTLKKGKPLRN